MTKVLLTLVVLLANCGCASQPETPSGPSPSARCRQQIEKGLVYAGQSDSEFLERCGPVEASQVGELRLYRFVILRGYEGLMVVAKDGHLVSAFHWTDYSSPRFFFDTMSDADRSLLDERVFFGSGLLKRAG